MLGATDFVDFFELPCAVVVWILDFGNKRSLSIVAVAGVQVDVEDTAARIESAVAWSEAIMKTEHVYNATQDYTLYKTVPESGAMMF